MTNTYCYVGDLLGFKNIILNLEQHEQAKRVKEWIDLVTNSAERFKIFDFQLVSDTVFAVTNNELSGLETLLDFSRYMLEEGIKKSLPLRGAISIGDVNWNSHIKFGKAIIEAYNLANRQEWIGTSCEMNLPHLESLWDVNNVIKYPVPMKNGLVEYRPVVSWNIPSYETLKFRLNSRGLEPIDNRITFDFANKLNNTIIFSLYLTMLRERTANSNGDKRINYFRSTGLPDPLQWIENTLYSKYLISDWCSGEI